MDKPIVVYVENDQIIRKSLTQLLSDSYDMKPYADAETALAEIRTLLQEGKKPVLLTETRLADGVGLIKTLSDDGVKIPTVVLCTYFDKEIQEKLEKAKRGLGVAGVGFDEYLLKGAQSKEIDDAIRYAIQMHQPYSSTGRTPKDFIEFAAKQKGPPKIG